MDKRSYDELKAIITEKVNEIPSHITVGEGLSNFSAIFKSHKDVGFGLTVGLIEGQFRDVFIKNFGREMNTTEEEELWREITSKLKQLYEKGTDELTSNLNNRTKPVCPNCKSVMPLDINIPIIINFECKCGKNLMCVVDKQKGFAGIAT